MKTKGFFTTKDHFNIAYQTNFDNLDGFELPVIIFNYGLVCSNAHWKYQIPFFNDLGYPIVLHDYRFHFDSSSSENINDCNFQGMANDLVQLMDHLSIESAIMLGHSMGVNVTLEIARRFPEKVKQMVLISGTVLPPQDIMFDSNYVEIVEPYIKLFSQVFPDIFTKIWKSAPQNPLLKEIIFKGGFNTKTAPREFIDIYVKKISELKPDIFFQLLDEMKRHDIVSYLEDIPTPTLVIGGDKDQVIPNYLQKILHDHLPVSELYIVKDGSHVPQVDFPETINERILHFLEKFN
ncbi:MAG: alpha/beta fold hydrolase [Bdellovibrio sp.]